MPCGEPCGDDNGLQLLHAVGFAALSAIPPESWARKIDAVLAQFGGAIGADRVIVSRNEPVAEGGIACAPLFVWQRPEAADGIGDARAMILRFQTDGLESWCRRLAEGGIVAVQRSGCDDSEQAALAAMAAQSLLAVPIIAGTDFWGMMALHCLLPKGWRAMDIEALKTVAAIVGAALHHCQSRGQAVPAPDPPGPGDAERPWAERQDMAVREQDDHDPLTGLPNRRGFEKWLRQALAEAQHGATRLALLLINIDHFKRINDILGHGVGDNILAQISRRLGSGLRRTDTLARFGGDVFTTYMANFETFADAEAVARNILATLHQPIAVGGHEHVFTASIGIALYPEDGETVELLLGNAETAMYCSRQRGRNRHGFFAKGMNENARSRLKIEHDLRHAIARDELAVHYQPVIDLRQGTVAGFEVLLRWHHPEHGLLAPNSFIPIAEETSLILPITDWVARQATKEMQDSAVMLLGAHLAINVSGHQFRDGTALSVAETLVNSGQPPLSRVIFEITENVMIQGDSAVLDTLHGLKRAGVAIALDDFGTGYSSLAYLHRFPIDYLKIDKSFVQAMDSSADSRKLIGTIITMAHDLSLQVIAEGVETAEQMRHLQRRGCEFAQGFFFARPMPAETAKTFARTFDPARYGLSPDPSFK